VNFLFVAARVLLVLGGAVSVVDGVAERGAVLFRHFRVAAQYVVVLGILGLVEGTCWGGIGT
jgi:hypothetical protein